MTIKAKSHFIYFALGSSICISIFPIIGLGLASAKQENSNIDWQVVTIVFPFLLGTFNVFTNWILAEQTIKKMALAGATLGLALSSLGLFVLNYPERVYGLEGNLQYLALIGGPIFYGLLWAFPMRWLNNSVKLNEN